MAGLELEGFHYKSESDDKSTDSDSSCYIDYSVKVVGLLTDKMKAHNKSYASSRVTLSQLKQVYREAAKNHNQSNKLPEWCLAKVNMFLRMKSGEAVYKNTAKKKKREMTGLELDTGVTSYQSSFDLSANWEPSAEDISLASKDLEEKELNFDFKSIDNLYLDDYKQIDVDWS